MPPQNPGVSGRPSCLDRYLTHWTFGAMAAGVAGGYAWPEGVRPLNVSTRMGTTSIPIAIGVILMMYAPLATKRPGLSGDSFSRVPARGYGR